MRNWHWEAKQVVIGEDCQVFKKLLCHKVLSTRMAAIVQSGDWFAEVQAVHVHLDGCPVAVSGKLPSLSFVIYVLADSGDVEVVGRVGWVQEAWGRGH